MPKKEHLPSVSDKEQRMYEHIKKSERESGRSEERSKEICRGHGRQASQQVEALQRQVAASHLA